MDMVEFIKKYWKGALKMEWKELYEKLVNTDTGRDVDKEEKVEKTRFVAGILKDLGFKVEEKDGAFMGIMGNPPYTTLIGHLDTVFPRGEPERRPFRIEGDKALGPGVADMKGGIVVLIEALKKFLEEKGQGNLCVVLNLDEELGSPWSRKVFEEVRKDTKYCLSFEPGRENGSFVSSRRGIASLLIEVAGKKAHASRLDLGANAILELSLEIPEIYKLNEEFEDLSLNPTLINGGEKSNITPDKAKVFFDVRFDSMDSLNALKERIDSLNTKVKGTSKNFVLEVRRPPMKESSELVELVRKVAKDLNMEISFTGTPGGGDAAFFSEAGVPSLDGFGIPGGNFHSEEEYALLNEFENRIKLTVEVLKKLEGE